MATEETASIGDHDEQDAAGVDDAPQQQPPQPAAAATAVQPLPPLVGYHVLPSMYQHHQGVTQHPAYYYQQPMPYGEQYGTAFYHHHGYQYPLGQMEGNPSLPPLPGLASGGSTDPMEAVLGRFPCARLQNLPYEATVEDILVLFQGLVVIDIVLPGGSDAFVIFANHMEFQMALRRNRQTIGRRFIEIIAASRNEYYEAVAAVYEQERGSSNLTAMTVDDGMRGGRRGDGRDDHHHHHQPSGNTASSAHQQPMWSPQTNQSHLHPALQHTFDPMIGSFTPGGGMGMRPGGPRGMMDPSRVMMHPSQQQQMQQQPKRTGGGIQVGEHTGFLRMRGLPFSAAKEDIYDFFIGYNPLLDSIVLTYRNDGRATGEAYVGFVSPGDAERAMALHRQSMGNRYIELFISNKEEHGRALGRFGPR